ncbi:RING finger protein 214 isoform 1 [Cinnamomum micranthum f. kanehirae]|uniref:RING finger protein 214 isoform 1 n=1 Tax=Cinnamomum micranthum f. kanehirae TaxID=337451 RepID=A0A3S3N532_9MAGN|nr:RING finger protein 214 isoform 1 [Cinnamomum micranthum f. kanehirae]
MIPMRATTATIRPPCRLLKAETPKRPSSVIFSSLEWSHLIFFEKLGSIHMSVPNNMNEEGSSWDMVSETDLWEGYIDDDNESDQDGYVLVGQEDIVDGIACFMAAYLLSLKQSKELTPNQLQEALSKTFSQKKKRGKLRKAWDGSKIIYNVASWSATAIGIYQNPALFKAASVAFWTSCHVVSKLL